MLKRQDRLALLRQARLYAIIDTGYVAPDRIEPITRSLVQGQVDLIQFRAKGCDEATVVNLGKMIRRLIPRERILYILNDHSHLAAQIDADGVHVGQDDAPLLQARRQAGAEMICGKSTHSLPQAIAASREGADYIGVGPIYATGTKPDYHPVGPALIGEVRSAVRVPQFCIGGIKESSLPEVLASGGRRVVIVSALLQSPDIPAYTRRVRAMLEQHPLDFYPD